MGKRDRGPQGMQDEIGDRRPRGPKGECGGASENFVIDMIEQVTSQDCQV